MRHTSSTIAPAISVLMPCYNAAPTLPAALESLAAQTLENFEVIAVDDGSQDATAEILDAWQRADPRLLLIRTPRQGIIEALNTGLQACRAGLVARMDADDRCHPQRLRRQFEFLQEHQETALVGCCVTGFPAGQVGEGLRIYLEWQNSLISNADIRREIFVESPLTHPSVLFRKAWIEKVGAYQEHRWAEDYDLWLRLYLAGARFAKLPETLLEWREHADRLTRRDRRYSLENFLRLKACYLLQGPLKERKAVILWGAGMVGRRLSKHLRRGGAPLVGFIDIDARKIGGTRGGLPIRAPQELPAWWQQLPNPVLLAAVGARGARQLIRTRLNAFGLQEGQDWWGAA